MKANSGHGRYFGYITTSRRRHPGGGHHRSHRTDLARPGRIKTRFQLYLAATVANLTLVDSKAWFT